MAYPFAKAPTFGEFAKIASRQGWALKEEDGAVFFEKAKRRIAVDRQDHFPLRPSIVRRLCSLLDLPLAEFDMELN